MLERTLIFTVPCTESLLLADTTVKTVIVPYNRRLTMPSCTHHPKLGVVSSMEGSQCKMTPSRTLANSRPLTREEPLWLTLLSNPRDTMTRTPITAT